MLASLLLSAEPPDGGVTSGHNTGREEGGWEGGREELWDSNNVLRLIQTIGLGTRHIWEQVNRVSRYGTVARGCGQRVWPDVSVYMIIVAISYVMLHVGHGKVKQHPPP